MSLKPIAGAPPWAPNPDFPTGEPKSKPAKTTQTQGFITTNDERKGKKRLFHQKKRQDDGESIF